MRETLSEYRAWLPQSAHGIPQEHHQFLGTVVEVRGWYWVSERRELASGLVFYSGTWWGYVVELDRQVPESELMILVQPHDHYEGNTNA
jgi:hypothetical protein